MPPSPPPPSPPAPRQPETIASFTFVIAGSVESFDKEKFRNSLATLVGVAQSDILLSAVSPSSVTAEAQVRFSSAVESDVATMKLMRMSNEELSSSLGVDVISFECCASSSNLTTTSPPLPLAESVSEVITATIVTLTILVILCSLCWFCKRYNKRLPRRQTKPVTPVPGPAPAPVVNDDAVAAARSCVAEGRMMWGDDWIRSENPTKHWFERIMQLMRGSSSPSSAISATLTPTTLTRDDSLQQTAEGSQSASASDPSTIHEAPEVPPLRLQQQPSVRPELIPTPRSTSVWPTPRLPNGWGNDGRRVLPATRSSSKGVCRTARVQVKCYEGEHMGTPSRAPF